MKDHSGSSCLGLDEAGRGPALGPLVLAGVAADQAQREELRAWGVKDSKEFGSGPRAEEERARLADKIQRSLPWAHLIVSPAQVDKLGIDEAERAAARDILGRLSRPGLSILCDGRRIFGPLKGEFPSLRAEDKADALDPSVAAASILAKHYRDQEWARIRDRYEPDFGPLRGGGYPNPPTVKFMAEHLRRRGDLPPEARRSWGPCRALLQGRLPFSVAGETPSWA